MVVKWTVLLLFLSLHRKIEGAPRPLTLTSAILDRPKKTGGRVSQAINCINDLSTYAQLAKAHHWVIVTLQKQSVIYKVELHAPGGKKEPKKTTIENADVFVVGTGSSLNYCGEATKNTKTGGKYTIECQNDANGNKPTGGAVKVQSNSDLMKLARIIVFGIEQEGAGADEMDFVEREFRTSLTPAPTKEPYSDDRNEIFQEPDYDNSTGVEVVKIKEFKEEVPYRAIKKFAEQENATKSVVGYFAFAGYVDYSLDEKLASEDPDKTEEPKTTFDNDNMQAAIQSFLRFNGYVEDGKITKEMTEYMQKDRCGNADLVYTEEGDKCTSKSRKIQSAVQNTDAFTLPGSKRDGVFVAETASYYLEVDVKFTDVRNGQSRAIFLGFNYDSRNANGQDTPLEVVALRFRYKKLCAQFLTVAEGKLLAGLVSKKTVLESCYTPTEDEKKTLAFKFRLDVYEATAGLLNEISVTIRGKEVAKNVYKTKLYSSAVVMHREDHQVTLSRVCKRSILSSSPIQQMKKKRGKRFALSNHKWGIAGDTLRFNFQNYSSEFGQQETRMEVLKALNLFTSIGFKFQEVVPTATAEIVFMFIKGRHADGRTYYGPGVEKAHAFTPTHSEIHFNDYQTFSNIDGKGKTSMFYVAAHEIGHALGLLHSQNEDALMQPGYPTSAFTFNQIHNDDIRALNTLYPEVSGIGSLEKLNKIVLGTKYTAKSPYPRECHSQIDAAVQVEAPDSDFAYIVSGPFIWRMKSSAKGWTAYEGYPKRVTDVFQQAYGTIEALIKVKQNERITIFALYAGNLISRYNLIPRKGEFEPLISLDWAGKERNTILTHAEVVVDENIRSAFNVGDKTIIVADNLKSYYEVTWNVNKKGVVKGAKTITNTDKMDSIIGRKLQKVHFNAAMTFQRKVNGSKRENIYMFGATYVFVEEPFVESRVPGRIWYEVQDHFKVAGWCPARNA